MVKTAEKSSTAKFSVPSIPSILVLLTISSLVLRVINLNHGIWYDEILTLVKFVRPSLMEILTTYPSENQHMFYSVLSHLSVSIFGEHIWSLRLPAVIFGTLSIPALYYLGSLVTSRRESLLAATLLMVSYHHIWFSQNARGYSGLLFWTILSTYLFIRGLKENRKGIWIAFAIVNSLGIYTHLTMLFVATSQFLCYVYFGIIKQRYDSFNRLHFKNVILYGFGLSAIITVLIYFPILPDMFHHIMVEKKKVASEWTNPLWSLFETLRGLSSGFGKMILGAIGAIALFGAGFLSYFRKYKIFIFLFLLPAILGLAALVLMQHNIWPRFFFFLFGFILLFVVRGAMVISTVVINRITASNSKAAYGKLSGTVVVFLLIVASVISLRYVYSPKQDYEGVIHYFNSNNIDTDAKILTVGMTVFPFSEYYKTDWTAIETAGELNRILAQGNETWLIYSFSIYMQSRLPEIWSSIKSNFQTVDVFRGTIGGGEIYVCKARRKS